MVSQCPVFSTDTNVISLWGSDWDPSMVNNEVGNSTVHVYMQNKSSDFDEMYGINAKAVHVLYSFVHKYVSGKARKQLTNPATFSASFYEDGSIRIRYHIVDAVHEAPDVYGLWGSIASDKDTPGTRYHEEAIAPSVVASDTDVTFCLLHTVACAPETVVYAGGEVLLRVLGDPPSCTALGEPLQMACVWAGGGAHGEFLTIPEFTSMESSARRSELRCPVPTMAFADNSLISLDVRFGANMSSALSPLSAGEKAYTAKHLDGASGELTTSHVMLRYFSSEGAAGGWAYGCNAVATNTPGLQSCDACLVCGGNGTSVDCNGECFGVAFVDSCGGCAGGSTGIAPCNVYDKVKNWEDANMLDTISKTILLLTMMICMTFVFSACMRVVRASFSIGQEHRHIDGGLMGMIPRHPLRRGNGLSRFEIDALGQFQYLVSSCGSKSLDGPDIEHATSIPLVPDLCAAECAICLNDLHDGDACRQLPCDHLFHVDCIDQWFTLSVACPMCKRNIRAIIMGDAEEPQRGLQSRPRAPSGETQGIASTRGVEDTRSDEAGSESADNPLIELTSGYRSNRSSGGGNIGGNSGSEHTPISLSAAESERLRI